MSRLVNLRPVPVGQNFLPELKERVGRVPFGESGRVVSRRDGGVGAVLVSPETAWASACRFHHCLVPSSIMSLVRQRRVEALEHEHPAWEEEASHHPPDRCSSSLPQARRRVGAVRLSLPWLSLTGGSPGCLVHLKRICLQIREQRLHEKPFDLGAERWRQRVTQLLAFDLDVIRPLQRDSIALMMMGATRCREGETSGRIARRGHQHGLTPGSSTARSAALTPRCMSTSATGRAPLSVPSRSQSPAAA
jgi:hypothetical protein